RARRARSLSRLQGVQTRMSGERGYGRLQGRIHASALSGPDASAFGLFHGPDLVVGTRGQRGAGCGEWTVAHGTVFESGEMDWRVCARAGNSALCQSHIPALVSAGA